MRKAKKIKNALQYHDFHGFGINYDTVIRKHIELNLEDGLWREIHVKLERIINEIDVAIINDLIVEKGFQEGD